LSSSPGRSRLAELARLVRQADAAEAAGRAEEAASLLGEVVRLDPGDKRALHRLGDLNRFRLKRLGEAGRCYAAEARAEERDDFQARALALWRLVVRCDPAGLEAHERIGALCVALGRLADARANYETTAREMERAGRVPEAAILRAHLAALADFRAPLPEAAVGTAQPPTPQQRTPTTTRSTSRPTGSRTGASSTTTACSSRPGSSSRSCW
jgi:tetratricopeptide (TPR) repeat protein